MKYIKEFEDFEYANEELPLTVPINFKIGDHVKPIKTTGNSLNVDVFEDQIYTIIRIFKDANRNKNLSSSTDPYDLCDLVDKNNIIYKVWYLKRFKPAETEYQANKYNL